MDANVWQENGYEIYISEIRNIGIKQNRIFTVPGSLAKWKEMSEEIRGKIWNATGVEFDDSADLEYQEHNVRKMDGYEIRGITYKSREGIYVTGSLYIPEGKGPFPAVIDMHGHTMQGRLAERVQQLPLSQVKNGYVALAVDAFGSGERSDIHGEYAYHGAGLGASLFDIGESLLGAQLVDNMRGVSLLCSLPFVDKDNIGATGGSGGGNQTMWLAAMDERIKAAVPVVSVGTFESYIDRMNCICECLPGGLTFTEEWGVLSLIAPRALKICNGLHDKNPAFSPQEMLRSYNAAKKIYQLHGKWDCIANEIFNKPHGYWPVIRASMLGWFERFLKGNGDGSAIAEKPFQTLREEEVMGFEKGKRPDYVTGIGQYCIARANHISEKNSSLKNSSEEKTAELKNILCLDIGSSVINTHLNGEAEFCGRSWQKVTLEVSDGKIIPALVLPPLEGDNWITGIHPNGKTDFIRENEELIKNTKDGILTFDLPFTGEFADPRDAEMDYKHSAPSRALWWTGKSLAGEWVKFICIVADYISQSRPVSTLSFTGMAEAAAVGLLAQVIQRNFSSLTLKKMLKSFIYSETNNNLSMGFHIKGIIPWGDIELALKLANCKVLVENYY